MRNEVQPLVLASASSVVADGARACLQRVGSPIAPLNLTSTLGTGRTSLCVDVMFSDQN